MFSCNQDCLNPSDAPSAWNEGTRAEKNPLDEIDFSALDTAYFVSDRDVEAYIHFKQLLADGQGKDFEVLEIVPMGLNDEATLAYLLNYNDGWEIIAADKRAPVVLATDETGFFSIEEAPKNVMAWIECLELDVLYLRSFNGRPEMADYEAWEKMLSCIDFWKAINADEEFILRNLGGTRVIPDSLPIIEFEPHDEFGEGHWELYSTSCSTEVYDAVRLTNTTWNQHEHYNNRAPYRTDLPNPYVKTAVGCAAVASAQLLFYLNKTYGYPEYTPRDITCAGYFSAVPLFTESLEVSSTLWDHMFVFGVTPAGLIDEAQDSASILISTCANRLELVYSNEGGALTNGNYYKTKLFASYNIDCSLEMGYNPSIVMSELLNGMPVIASACRTRKEILGYVYYEDAHSFLIDGYKRYRTRTENTYIFVYPENVPIPENPEFSVQISYSTPYITKLAMNWGYYQYGNSSWYEPTGNWAIGPYSYDYLRKMVTGFTNIIPIE